VSEFILGNIATLAKITITNDDGFWLTKAKEIFYLTYPTVHRCYFNAHFKSILSKMNMQHEEELFHVFIRDRYVDRERDSVKRSLCLHKIPNNITTTQRDTYIYMQKQMNDNAALSTYEALKHNDIVLAEQLFAKNVDGLVRVTDTFNENWYQGWGVMNIPIQCFKECWGTGYMPKRVIKEFTELFSLFELIKKQAIDRRIKGIKKNTLTKFEDYFFYRIIFKFANRPMIDCEIGKYNSLVRLRDIDAERLQLTITAIENEVYRMILTKQVLSQINKKYGREIYISNELSNIWLNQIMLRNWVSESMTCIEASRRGLQAISKVDSKDDICQDKFGIWHIK
jgi:hypothetical protein